jgi:hypothetical protein
MKKKYFFLLIIFIILIIIFSVYLSLPHIDYEPNVYDFNSCSKWSSVTQSFPEECNFNGKLYINEEQNRTPGKYNHCQVDDDCVPLPYKCDPKTCINYDYINLFDNTPSNYNNIVLNKKNNCSCINNMCTYIDLDKID